MRCTSKPQAMMSLQFSRASRRLSSTDSPLRGGGGAARHAAVVGRPATTAAGTTAATPAPPLTYTSTHLHRNFSSSVSWMTSGTLNASCSHLVNMKGTRCPRCSASLDGPCMAGAVGVVRRRRRRLQPGGGVLAMPAAWRRERTRPV